MKLNRKLVLVLSLVLSLAIATGSTLAYLTDRDSEVNVFTVGDVSIDLTETFDQGSTLLPGVDIEKKPIITNTGRNDAWVWATIAIPAALDTPEDASQNIIHFNYTKESVVDGLWNWKDETDNWMIDEVEIEGVAYNLYTVLYETPLKPGEATTEPVITKVYLDPHVDVAPDGQMYWVEKGVTTELDWNIEEIGPAMYVSAYAIQTAGFDSVQAAYAAYTEQWGDNGYEFGVSSVTVTNAAELLAALAEAEAGSVIELAAGEYGVINLDGTLTDVTIKAGEDVNVKFNIASSAVLTNVTIDGLTTTHVETSAAYVDGGIINIDAGADVNNLVVSGADVEISGGRSSFIGCSEPTAEITVEDCKVNGAKYLLYASAPVAKLTVEGCEISNISSWLVMENAGDSVGAKLTISDNTFVGCTGGIAKYLGSTQPEGAATVFTNNTLTGCKGHDGKDSAWFTIPGATSTITVSGNKLDGSVWTPGIAQGLGK